MRSLKAEKFHIKFSGEPTPEGCPTDLTEMLLNLKLSKEVDFNLRN